MDLEDTPDGMPIASQVIVIKPENQSDISKTNGTRNIRFHIPEYIPYWLPSQSNFSFNIKMKGRGAPIPSRDAGFHSLFQTIRTHDGTGSHLIEEVTQYNTLVAQMYNYTKSEGADNMRAEYEGVQSNKTVDNNLYWALEGQINWAGGTVKQPLIARDVQIVAPLRTKLYDTSSYIPNACLNGVRLEMQLDNYLRSLEYTTGSLAIGAENGMAPLPLSIIFPEDGEIPATGGEAALPQFQITTAGTNYVAGNIYEYTFNATLSGYVLAQAVDGSGGITKASFFAHGMAGATASVTLPKEADTITLAAPAAGGSIAAVLVVTAGTSSLGVGRIGNIHQEFYAPLWAQPDGVLAAAGAGTFGDQATTGAAGLVLSPANALSAFGANTERDPTRVVTKKVEAAGYGTSLCYPGTVMPFSIGDKFEIMKLDGSGGIMLGLVSGIEHYTSAGGAASYKPNILYKPDIPVQTGLGNEIAAPAVVAGADRFGASYAFNHGLLGYKYFTDKDSRINGWTPTHITDAAFTTLLNAAKETVDFTISDIQYQAKQVFVPQKDYDADIAAKNSEKGLQIDLETVETRLTNQAQITGPTQNLISIPNITRALGVMSVPLDQTKQLGLENTCFRGFPDGMSTYQYELGQRGLVPVRPVPVEKASFGNPLIQTQHINEQMKVLDSFGLTTSNLNRVLMNYSIGRQFSRPNMFFNLMMAGDLTLRCQYDSQTFPKLFVHFINHIRSINVSKNGMEIMN
jgi:hypothetical protein